MIGLLAADTGAIQGSWTVLILYTLGALALSFTCSTCEAVVLTASRSYLKVLADSGKGSAVRLLGFKENIDRPISAILTLNTIAQTMGAAGIGAQAAAIFGSVYVGVVSAVLTLLVLVFAEVIPKILGAAYWRRMVTPVAWATQLMIWICWPIVHALIVMTRWIAGSRTEPSVTRSELAMMADIGTFEGTLEESEQRIIRNLLELRRVKVSEIMTPRTVVMALPADETVGDVLKEHKVLSFSRIPIYTERLDDASEFVMRIEVLTAIANDEHDTKLSELGRPLETIMEQATVADTLRELTAKGEHMFLVSDEHGGMAGLVTLEDAIESLMGLEITDESDVVADLRALARSRHERKLDTNRRRHDEHIKKKKRHDEVRAPKDSPTWFEVDAQAAEADVDAVRKKPTSE